MQLIKLNQYSQNHHTFYLARFDYFLPPSHTSRAAAAIIFTKHTHHHAILLEYCN